MFDITEPVVNPLGGGSDATEALFTGRGYSWDYALGGLPFLAATSREHPFQRGLVSEEKPQFDTADVAGEQSLASWWLRSQLDFSGGAGQKLFEPAREASVRSQFYSSQGVDVWGEDGFSILPNTRAPENVLSGDVVSVVGCNCTQHDYVIACDGYDTVRLAGDDTVTQVTGLSAQPGWLWSAGRQVLACHATGIDVITPSSATATSIYSGASSMPKAWWVKQRIIASVDNELFELTLSGGSWPAQALYSHPDPLWEWTSVAETPTSILAAGRVGSRSAIYRFSLEPDGSLPTLTSAITIAELPAGETVAGMLSYLGQYVVLGTDKGVRVAQVRGNEMQYGPLLFKTDYPVEHFTAFDSFVYAGVSRGLPDGSSGLVRIDLSQPLDDGSFPWATDLASSSLSGVVGVTQLGSSGRIVFGAGDVWVQGNGFADVAWLESSRVLFGTLEPKLFARVSLLGDTRDGSITVSRVDARGNSVSLFTFASDVDGELSLTGAGRDQVGFRFDLTAGNDSPVIAGWQLKALPASQRQEMINVQLLCYSSERNRDGVRREHDPWDRLQSIRDLVAENPSLMFQVLDTGEARMVQVKEFAFDQTVAPVGCEGVGGVISLSLRVV